VGRFSVDFSTIRISVFGVNFLLKLQENQWQHSFLKNVLNEETTDMFNEDI